MLSLDDDGAAPPCAFLASCVCRGVNVYGVIGRLRRLVPSPALFLIARHSSVLFQSGAGCHTSPKDIPGNDGSKSQGMDVVGDPHLRGAKRAYPTHLIRQIKPHL